MFRNLFAIMACAVILAACGNNNPATPPTAAPQSAPPTTNAGATPEQPLPTNGPREYSTEEVELPAVGTIVPPATQDPDAGQIFDTVMLNRSGGIAGTELNVVLTSDGKVTRDGVKSAIPADQVKQISDKLDQMGFFGMQGIFQAPGTSPDVYTYRLTAERKGASRTITAQDGYIPDQLADLLAVISQLGLTK